MQRYIARRLIQSALIVFVLSITVFLLLRIAPGADPALLRCGISCTEEKREAIREGLGLNLPYYPISLDFTKLSVVELNGESQYWRWIKEIFSGSLGRDINEGEVAEQLKRRLPVTVELLIITLLVTVAIGIPFGIVSAVYRNSPADYSARFAAILGLAVPSFWLATLVLLIPQQYWNYAPPLLETVNFFDSPWDNLRQFVPPAIVLGGASAATIMRLSRSSMLEVMRQDYVRTARSKGLHERVVIGRHALRNSLIPVVTVLGLQIAGAFAGAIIIEQIFNLQGIGQYFFTSLFTKDFQVAQTLTLYVGVVVVLMNLAVDIVYAWLDPRIRYT